MSNVTEVGEDTFEDQVLNADGKVVVDFWAPWCGPCKAVAPELDKLADKHTDVSFVKVNVDDAPNVAAKYQIMGVPTIAMFTGGQLEASSVGAKQADVLEKELKLA